MSIDRRDFFRIAGAAGLAVSMPWGPVHAAEDSKDGPFWVFVHAGGGWDPTSVCDPKGRANEEEMEPTNMYFTGDIGTAGNLKYAPVGSNREFFDKHYERLLVINGVDAQTNSHDAGTRHIWSGKLGEGYPALSALIAGLQARDLPMSYVSNGGYDFTAGLIAPTRTGNIDAVNRIAHPNRINGEPDGPKFHTDATALRIQKALERRRSFLDQRFQLPKSRAAISQLYSARIGKNEVKLLSEFLPEDFEREALKRQSQVACAAFRAGIAKTANLTIGGFDTHGDHDNRHFGRLSELLQGVDFLWDEADRQGIADKLTVVIGSDFGRTPGYNEGNGKDHWSVTSVMLMGRGISGNRVIGKTTDGDRNAAHRPFKVDPSTLAISEGGIRIEPKHIHLALRKLAGIEDHKTVRQLFPLLDTADLPLLKG